MNSKSTFIKAALAKYPLDASVKAKSNQRTLVELISRFPNSGKGLKVYKKTWQDHHYWTIYHVEVKGPRQVKYYGLEYKFGELKS